MMGCSGHLVQGDRDSKQAHKIRLYPSKSPDFLPEKDLLHLLSSAQSVLSSHNKFGWKDEWNLPRMLLVTLTEYREPIIVML